MLTTIAELRLWTRQQHAAGKRIGFVPTMGALHEGHLSLVRTADEQCDTTLVSIFVNPTQFGPNEDFNKYPRLLQQDVELLKTVGSPEVFAPGVEEMYPNGFAANVHIGNVSEPFEGRFRPTHFDGVATVVLKLFLMSGADVAFFGQKDFQQVCVVRKMVADLNIPIEITVCPIVRESDGLAMSSRNRYLTPSQREQSLVLSKSLAQAEKLLVGERIRDAELVRLAIQQTLRSAPEAVIDYVAIADPKTLQELTVIDPSQTPEVVVLLAVKIGTTRLIDNCVCRLRPCDTLQRQ